VCWAPSGSARTAGVGDLGGALGDDRHRARPRVLEEQFERAVSLLGDAVFAISRTQPVLAVVEDVHWASSILRHFATDIARNVDGRPVLLVDLAV